MSNLHKIAVVLAALVRNLTTKSPSMTSFNVQFVADSVSKKEQVLLKMYLMMKFFTLIQYSSTHWIIFIISKVLTEQVMTEACHKFARVLREIASFLLRVLPPQPIEHIVYGGELRVKTKYCG